jgi:hypothetical protein
MSTPKWRWNRSPRSAGSGRGAVEHRRLHAGLRVGRAEPAFERGVRRGALAHQDRGGADRHREGQPVAQPVGEEELGRREAHVVLGQRQHTLAVQLGGPVGVGVGMHRALGPARRAGRVEPEAGVVAAGGRGLLRGGMGAEEGLELDLGRVQRRGRPRDDDLLHLVVRLDQRGGQRRQQRTGDQHGLRPRVLEHVGVVVGGQQRVDRHRHQPGVHRAEEAHRPVVAVLHQQQHTLFALDAQCPQSAGQPAHALVECAIGQCAEVVEESGLVGAGGVQRQQVLREVEGLAGDQGGHGVSFGVPGAVTGR